MPISGSDIVAGAFFRTPTDQLRKVVSVSDGKVHYLTKSINFKNRPFTFGHTKANPPSLETFIADCGKLLNAAEVEQLRSDGVILKDE